MSLITRVAAAVIFPMSRISRLLKHAVRASLAVAALTVCAPGLAVTECSGHVSRIWTGDSGSVWVLMDSTVPWYLTASDPNLKNILASATTALATGLSVSVRFQADGLTCGAGSARGDVAGMWLIGS